MVQQLRSLQPKWEIFPEPSSQTETPKEASHLLEDLEGALLSPKVKHNDDCSGYHQQVLKSWKRQRGRRKQTLECPFFIHCWFCGRHAQLLGFFFVRWKPDTRATVLIVEGQSQMKRVFCGLLCEKTDSLLLCEATASNWVQSQMCSGKFL